MDAKQIRKQLSCTHPPGVWWDVHWICNECNERWTEEAGIEFYDLTCPCCSSSNTANCLYGTVVDDIMALIDGRISNRE